MEKAARWAASFVFTLYLYDTRFDYKTCQISSVALAGKWFGMLGNYFGF
jgi:hypothetical protein